MWQIIITVTVKRVYWCITKQIEYHSLLSSILNHFCFLIIQCNSLARIGLFYKVPHRHVSVLDSNSLFCGILNLLLSIHCCPPFIHLCWIVIVSYSRDCIVMWAPVFVTRVSFMCESLQRYHSTMHRKDVASCRN